ncbi:MAG: hypothetical protein Q4P24_17950, partial [Rhodobacterales bacterium]|nr:hypothetical protein [Rhodobacterales bacterium]
TRRMKLYNAPCKRNSVKPTCGGKHHRRLLDNQKMALRGCVRLRTIAEYSKMLLQKTCRKSKR